MKKNYIRTIIARIWRWNDSRKKYRKIQITPIATSDFERYFANQNYRHNKYHN